ncbi:DUF547 domain-containing protein [Vibrio sp. FNV 38]|nr:DUF547 domain-containing protein [Vibrio sp. FNV 38]
MLRFFTLLLSVLTFSVYAAPKSELWSIWTPSNESSSQTISHKAWQAILDSYIVNNGQHNLFHYKSVSPEDKEQLKNYIKNLASIDPLQFSRAEQFAYWVNLYNAITVDLILDNYPVKSITKLGGLFSFGPWGQKVVTVNSKELTLNDIEHRILRPIWNDSRVHYAVNCASLGCPNLQNKAFTASNTQALLELAANQFINSEKGASLNKDILTLSEIYEWFVDDFGDQNRLFEHLGQHRPELIGFKGKIRYKYDWSLNDVN